MKKTIWIIFIILLLDVGMAVSLENKVVVIPLMEEVNTQKNFFAAGIIHKDGYKVHVFGNPFTVTKKSGPGIYELELEAFNVGCEPPLIPVFTATATTPGIAPATSPGIVSFNPTAETICSTGNTTFTVNTWAITGVPADFGFSFSILRRDVD